MFLNAETQQRATSRVGRNLAASIAIICLFVSGAGCLVRRREKIPTGAPIANLKVATLSQLLEQLANQDAAIKTINATVQLEPTVSSTQKGEIVTYHDVRAFVMIRKPALLRMIGQAPVVRNTVFDLASDGEHFELSVPSKNRYVTGSSVGGKRSESGLENLRPQHLLDVLLWKGPERGREQAALEAATDGQKSYYIVLVLRPDGNGNLVLARKLWFERVGLALERLQVFDETGEIATDARYSNYGNFGGIAYPQQIVFNRPQDQYGLSLTVSQVQFNQPIADDKFRMEPPPGVQIVNLEQAA